jgi:hypothetical protein
MKTNEEQNKAFDKAMEALDRAASKYYCDGRYGVFRAVQNGEDLPADLEDAFNNAHAACMSWGMSRI